MSEIDDGGPAFPSTNNVKCGEYVTGGHTGVSIRDYFAAKAMQGICAHQETWGLQIEGVATNAYAMADAMLAARSKK